VAFGILQLTQGFEEEATVVVAILVLGTASFVIRRIDGTSPAADAR
jgi:hypothetical protein